MALTREEVEHVAHLARIELTDEEVARYQHELTRILEYVGQLGEVDTSAVEPTAQVTGLVNRVRDDVAAPADPATRRRLLEAMPERDGDYLKVRAVFE